MNKTIDTTGIIYLDYNASTPVDKEVADAMVPFLTQNFGNPSSNHAFGLNARTAIETARARVAEMLNCHPDEIVFTAGGTESNNMAIKGAAYANRNKGKHIIISAVEHPAVAEVAEYLKSAGFDYSVAPVDSSGRVDVTALASLIRKDTILISVMHANNEVGTLQPIEEIAALAARHKVLLHSDAAQSTGKVPVNVQALGVDLLSIAGHKMYAPIGVGALYIKRGTFIEKYMHGANHENNRRPGTENVAYIVGLGKAAGLVCDNLVHYTDHMQKMKQRLISALKASCPQMRINGNTEWCLPNTLNVSFRNIGSQKIIPHIKNLAVSVGAACHSDSGKSGTLEAMHLPPEYSYGALRISTGRYTTTEEIDKAADTISNALQIITEDEHSGNKAGVKQVHESKKTIRLTDYAHGLGCGCKMRPSDLQYILADFKHIPAEVVKVGIDTQDDAAVYMLDGENAIVQTVDFFTPMLNDPYAFGAIAAANAISDIYAMGAEPLFALNLVAFPVNELPLDVLREIIRGAKDKAEEAGIPILGGHSIEDNGIKFGMVVSGKVHLGNLVTNDSAKPGDLLVLTKPLGSGIITKALSEGLAEEDELQAAIDIMSSLNKSAAEIMRKYGVKACTDITGFGLTGHLHQMLRASGVNAWINYNRLPFLPGVEKLASIGAIPGSSKANLSHYSKDVDFTTLSETQKLLTCDAQTSGGLLICVSENEADAMIKEMLLNNIQATFIGKVINGEHGDSGTNHKSKSGNILFSFSDN